MSLKFLSLTFHMISDGLNNFGLYKTKNFHRHIYRYSLPTPYERWKAIGKRLNNALQKVVDEY